MTGRAAKVVGGAVLLAVGVGAGWWAAATLLEPPPDVLAAPAFALVEAREGSVGQSLRVSASGQWATTATFQGFGSGVVTERVLTEGDVAEPGTVLATIDLRPVVIAEGSIPAFRDLSQADRGADVAQLQELLTATGHWSGAVDGVFTARLRGAVQQWQRSLGLPRDGVVRRGDIVFVPELPARLAPAASLRVGTEVSGTWDAVHVLDDAPSFTIPLNDQQMVMVEPGAPVDVHADGILWSGVVGSLEPEVTDGDEFRPQHVTVTAADGGPLCAQECDRVPVAAPSIFSASIHVVPHVEGVVVPAAAVVTGADGATFVRLEDGTLRPVELVASATGSAAVLGLDVGTPVRTPGDGG